MKRELPATLRVRAAAGDGRTIDGVAVPWNTPITIDGRREQFAPGALEADQVVGRPLRWRHSEPIGVVTDAHDRADGMHVSARIAATRAGDDAVALLREMPDMGLSVGFEERSWTVAAREDVFTITRADLVELSLTDLPAYPTARVTATREDPMNTTDVDVSEPDTAAPETREAVTVSDVSNTELGAQLHVRSLRGCAVEEPAQGGGALVPRQGNRGQAQGQPEGSDRRSLGARGRPADRPAL